jgi:RNA recognition motif-containing protein
MLNYLGKKDTPKITIATLDYAPWLISSLSHKFQINKIMRLFVGNLPWSIGDDELRDLFSEFGEVTDSKVINDRETGRSRGFGFIEMDDDGGDAAIKSLDGSEQDGRDIRVNVAEERKPRDNNRGGGGGGGDRRDNNRW